VKRCALVIGHGSIGRRHAEVLDGLGFAVSVVSRRGAVADRESFHSVTAALAARQFDYVVVANETGAHEAALAELSRAGHSGLVLVEKPLMAATRPLQAGRFERAGVGYNLRFHPVVAALREALAGRHVEMASFYVGQWLGDWRPGREAAQTYSASKAAGGGALRDLSHELDLAIWLLGPWHRVAALGGRLGHVTVDADDAWSILLSCARCPVVTVQLNCLDRQPRRTITLHGGGETWHADLIAGTLTHNEMRRAFEVERNDTFARLHRAMIASGEEVCTFDEGLQVVALIEAVEQAAAGPSWVEKAA